MCVWGHIYVDTYVHVYMCTQVYEHGGQRILFCAILRNVICFLWGRVSHWSAAHPLGQWVPSSCLSPCSKPWNHKHVWLHCFYVSSREQVQVFMQCITNRSTSLTPESCLNTARQPYKRLTVLCCVGDMWQVSRLASQVILGLILIINEFWNTLFCSEWELIPTDKWKCLTFMHSVCVSTI